MNTSDNATFVEKIKHEQRVIASPRPETGFDNKVTDAQLNFHNQWAKAAFSQSKYKFSYTPIKNLYFPDTSSLINDLTPLADSSKKDDLDINRIKEIYNMKNDTEIKYGPLSSAISYDLSFAPKIPHDLLQPDYGWLSISLGKCSLPKDYESQSIAGFLQLYDGKNTIPISEPVRFHITKGEALFSQTIASSVNFPVSIKNPYILCVLNYIQKGIDCSVPFCLNIIPFFNEKGQFLQPKKFTSKWAVYSGNYEELIQKVISNDDSIEKVDIDFNFNTTFSEKLEREFSYSWSLTPNTNYYVSPFPNASYQSTPTILLFNFNLTMKYPSNSKYVFLKLYITDGIENITSPKKLSLFSGIEMGKFSDCYVTTALKTNSKEVEFIDQVSIFVDRVFNSNTCIVFHIFSFDNSKSGPTLLGYSAIPLFQDGDTLPFGSYRLKIFDIKKPPKEMKKLIRKSNKKKEFLQCKIRLPPPYFPPATVKNVIDAVMPEQALPPNYKEISLDVYQRQILPMTGKLLKIIAPNTALHLIRFLDIFEGEKGNVKNTLRSWIFNVMNPELFGSNFINNLCKSFKSVINDELWNKASSVNSSNNNINNNNNNDPSSNLRETKNLLLKQLGFALPLILDIILVSVSTPDLTYDKETVLDFLQLIPSVIYGLIKMSHAKVSHVKNENQNQWQSSRTSHSHHSGHSQQRKVPIASGDSDQSSSSSQLLENQETSKSSSASSIDSSQDSSIMAPIRLPPQAMSPIIPDLQNESSSPRPVSSTNAALQSVRSSRLIVEKTSSGNVLQQKKVTDEIELNNHFANLVSCLLPIVGFDKISPIIFKYIRFLNTKKTNHSLSGYLSYLQFSFLMPFSFSEQFIVELALCCKAQESSGVSAYIPILSQVYLVLHKSLGGGQNEKGNQNENENENENNSHNNSSKSSKQKVRENENENENEKEKEKENLKGEIDAINVACQFFANVCLSAERLPSDLSMKVAFILFPLINTISSNYEGTLVKENSQVLMELIPIILFILNSSSTTLIKSYFSELGVSFQLHFMNFLEFIVRLSIEKLNSIRPVSIKVKRSGGQSISQSDYNLNFFSVLTQQILNFLMRTIDIIGPCIDLVIKLLSSLYNSYQPIANIKPFYVVCANLIQKYPVNRSIIAWLLSLLSFEQPDTKCFACSLLVLVFEADFKNSKTVIISSIDMMDSLTAVLLAVPVKYIPTYQTLLNRIITLTKADSNMKSGIQEKKEFEKIVNERMNAALIISNVVQEQKQSTSPPEIRCQRLMRIADQYKAFPTMRLKWLQEIVKVNNQQKFYSSAFTAQLHVCALIETVVHQLQTSNVALLIKPYNSISMLSSSSSSLLQPVSNQSTNSNEFDFFLKTTQPMRNAQVTSFRLDPKEDFSFMPGVLCETELNIELLAKDSQTLLSDFTIELLLESLNKAIELGKNGGFDYSLRPLYSLQLRIHQFKRNEPKEISEVLKKLADSIANIQTKNSMFYDIPLSFFLVETRKDKEKKKQVFCVENSMVDQFIPFIDSRGRFEEGTKVSICNSHTDESCNSPGVCVVRLQPVLSNGENEFDHCFKKFTTIQNFLNVENDQLDVVEYQTKDFLPHYRIAADVVTERRTKKSIIKHVQCLVENNVELLNRVAYEFEIWFSMKPSKSGNSKSSSSSLKLDEKLVLDDIKRISAVLRFVLKGNESIATILSVVSQKVDGGSLKKLANSIYVAVSRLLAVYRRAVDEFVTKQPNKSLLSLCEMMADEFAQQFGLEKIQAVEYVADYDPMNDGIEYNE